MMLTISHTREQGTLLDGTSRGDGTAEIVKPLGWRWFRTLGAWGLPNSRDREVKSWTVTRTQDALVAAGHTVAVQIDDTPRTAAEVEEGREVRAEARATALAAKAGRAEDTAGQAWKAHEKAHDNLPPFGEPIHVGHHSEGRHRRAIDKAWSSLGKAVDTAETAEEAGRRAQVAADATDRRNDPIRVGNRIRKLETEIRATQRALDGRLDWRNGEMTLLKPTETHRQRLQDRLVEQQDHLAYWQQVRAVQVAAGEATDYGRHNVKKGDQILYRGIWYPVRRVNVKSVSIPAMIGMGRDDMSWSDTVPWHEVKDHRPSV